MKSARAEELAKGLQKGIAAVVEAAPVDPKDPDRIPAEMKPLIHSGVRLALGLFVNVARIADALDRALPINPESNANASGS
jgi:hypothetical protein